MAKRYKPGFATQRREGWGMGLYRNRAEGWIAGVCAGFADHWNVPNWMVRIGVVLLFIFSGTLAFWGYIAAIFLLASRRDANDDETIEEVEVEVTETVTTYGPARSRSRRAPSDKLRRAQDRLDAALARMDRMA